VKFDGTIWTTYNKLNSSLPSDRIYTIAIDKTGNKWLGTNEGVVKFNDSTCTVYNKLNSKLPGDTISVITIDSLGNKWVGIASEYGGWWYGYKYGGLAIFNDTTWTIYTDTNSSLPRSYISSIAIDNSNTIWIGTYCGIVKLKGSEWTVINKKNTNLPSDSISSIVIDQFGNKWIGFTWIDNNCGICQGGYGLAKYDNESWQFFNTNNSNLPSNYIYSIGVDNLSNKWIGTTSGLAKFDDISWKVYNKSNSDLPDDKVNSITIDSSGNKWLSILTDGWSGNGYYDGAGVAKLDDTGWTIYSHSNTGLPEKQFYGSWVQSIAIDTLGNKWIGKYGSGISKFDDRVWKNYSRSNSSLPNDTINAIEIDSIGNIWIATFNGLSKFDGVNWTVYNTSNSELPSNIIYTVAIDKLGQKWIGTKDGLALFDDIKWTIYNNITWVSSICFDDIGNKWIGTSGNGVYKFVNQKWVNYTVFNSGLPSNWVSNIISDNSGNVWFCIPKEGKGCLAKFNGNAWLKYNTSNTGISDSDVMTMLIDESGRKWVGTNIGLFLFDGKYFTRYTSPISMSNFFFSAVLDSSGIIWLGAYNGLAKFYDYQQAPIPETTDTTENPTTGIFEKLENSIIIYPNPVNNNIIISHGAFYLNIEIYDMYGKLLLKQKVNTDPASIDVSYLQRGTYLIKIYSNNCFITKKINKQ
jgi:ligand-binding sensor domain-containing protein